VSALGEPTFAWEPLTPRGVAAFARASFFRLFLVQSVFALLGAGAVLWVLAHGVFPVIESAVDALPDVGGIHGGRLDWRDDSPVLLAEGRILAVGVDLDHTGQLRSPADFQLEFGRESLLVISLLGTAEMNYPSGYRIAANHKDAQPAWNAWAPNLLALAALGTFFGLLLVWLVLATLYFLPVWLISFFANRDLSMRASWRLAAAALMPGALLMSAALALYGLEMIDLVRLGLAFGLHLVVGWVYLFISPLFLNRASPKNPANPFTEAK
jgi:hypothetical protein